MYGKNPGPVFLAERTYTGDHEFNNLFIYSNKPEEAKRYFADESRRSVVKKLIAAGWQPPMVSGNSTSTL